MGFVNKPTGEWNEHQWNWPPDISGVSQKRAFHIETVEDAKRKKYEQSQVAVSNSPYYTPEQKAGDQSKLRSGVLYTQPRPKPSIAKRRTIQNLKFCEANMAMYLNSLRMDLFNEDNPVLQNLFSKMPNLSDSELSDIYKNIINNYNGKTFDPDDEIYTDGNGQEYTHSFKTINQSKSSPSMPTENEFIEAFRANGIVSTYKDLINKRGYYA